MARLSKNKALIIILSAPSGGGKTSIAKKLLEQDKKLSLSISVTTREPRPGEIDGVHYFFTAKSAFNKMLQDDLFLEHAEIYGNFYGTPLKIVTDKLSQDMDVLFDIDSQGAHQIIDKAQDQVISIFIKPPNLDILEKRLRSRAQDSDDVIARRLTLAQKEMAQAKHYDYIVVNDDFDQAVTEIQDIIANERRNERK